MKCPHCNLHSRADDEVSIQYDYVVLMTFGIMYQCNAYRLNEFRPDNNVKIVLIILYEYDIIRDYYMIYGVGTNAPPGHGANAPPSPVLLNRGAHAVPGLWPWCQCHPPLPPCQHVYICTEFLFSNLNLQCMR